MSNAIPRLYDELAAWWPLLSAPEDYAAEAREYAELLRAHAEREVTDVLELGSGGGNNASHLKHEFTMTLVDRAPGMLAVSRDLNPECSHVAGDMRDVRLGTQHDAVFVHDAVSYITSLGDLRRVCETARAHLRGGGVALFVPDQVRETFRPSTAHGGHDGEERALRYLSWTFDEDRADCTYTVAFACLLREQGALRAVDDVHRMGLFSREQWLVTLEETGFEALVSLLEVAGPREAFVGLRRAES